MGNFDAIGKVSPLLRSGKNLQIFRSNYDIVAYHPASGCLEHHVEDRGTGVLRLTGYKRVNVFVARRSNKNPEAAWQAIYADERGHVEMI